MDYTCIDRVKREMVVLQATDMTVNDAMITGTITAASRAVDRYCTGSPENDAVDYFKSETKTLEQLNAVVDSDGRILVYPHKPVIASVSFFQARENITKPWITVDPARVEVDGFRVYGYPASMGQFSDYRFGASSQRYSQFPRKLKVQMTYIGGLGTLDCSLPACTLPDDFVEAVTLLTARFMKEMQTGLTDVMGVTEMGQILYSKAYPVRFREMIESYKRKVGWRNIA